MNEPINIMLVGHSSSALNQLDDSLQEELDFEINRKHLVNGHVDPYDELPGTIDVVVLVLGENWRDVLSAVAARSARSRAAVILIGPEGNTDIVRLALKAGAKDFHSHPVETDTLVKSIRDVGKKRDISRTDEGELCVFMSAKGAAGASILACSVAHAMTAKSDKNNTLIMDLDLQYGSLPIYFDQTSNTKLTQTLLASELIDQTLLDACITRTESGIDILSSHSDTVFSSWDVSQNSVNNLLNLVLSHYSHVVVDIPKHIDPISFQAIEKAKKICIVLQQNLSDLRQARQIVGLLKDQGVANDRIILVVNRFEKKGVVRIADVEDAFEQITVVSVPNDYRKMAYAIDNNVSILKKWSSAPVSKSINNLCNSIWPPEHVENKGFFSRNKNEIRAS